MLNLLLQEKNEDLQDKIDILSLDSDQLFNFPNSNHRFERIHIFIYL